MLRESVPRCAALCCGQCSRNFVYCATLSALRSHKHCDLQKAASRMAFVAVICSAVQGTVPRMSLSVPPLAKVTDSIMPRHAAGAHTIKQPGIVHTSLFRIISAVNPDEYTRKKIAGVCDKWTAKLKGTEWTAAHVWLGVRDRVQHDQWRTPRDGTSGPVLNECCCCEG